MKIIIAGSSGFIGTELTSYLESEGHQVKRLVRTNKFEPNTAIWDPEKGMLDPKEIQGYDAVINLAGENIAKGRWTEEKKRKIHDSRIKATYLLAKTLSEMDAPPQIFINASAIGYYGTKEKPTNETGSPGTDFLAKVCKDWEEAAKPAQEKGIRVVFVRMGMVLSPQGGALAAMLPSFKWGLGATLGSGNQMVSWISLDDLVAIYNFCLLNSSIQGPINASSPNPVTNREFTQILAKVLRRPVLFSVPSSILKMIFGEMADALLLSDAAIIPENLLDKGFVFKYPQLETVFHHNLSV